MWHLPVRFHPCWGGHKINGADETHHQVSHSIICILQNINAGIYQEVDQNPGSSGLRCKKKQNWKHQEMQDVGFRQISAVNSSVSHLNLKCIYDAPRMTPTHA